MKVALTGATGFVGSHILADLYDRPAVTSLLADSDGAIHTASPGNATSADLDSAVVDAVTEAFAGTGRPYLHISGGWIYGNETAITKDSPMRAPAMVAWKEPIERQVLGATGMRGAVIVSGVAYGDGGGGIPGLLLGSPRDGAGYLIAVEHLRSRNTCLPVRVTAPDGEAP